jgi:hypothetical protein
MAVRPRVLAIAAASGRVGHVLLEDRRVAALGLSRKASQSASIAASCAANWIEQLRPDIVITERVRQRSKKGHRTRDVIAAMTDVADIADVLSIAVVRTQTHDNKYQEAAALAQEFPEIAHLVPKARRPWDPEPKTTVYFEALSLALSVIGGNGRNPILLT